MEQNKKGIFEDIISTLPSNEEKVQYCLTFEALKDLKYHSILSEDTHEIIYSSRDFRMQAQLFAGMLNSIQEMNDVNLTNLLENGLPPIFNDISLTGPVENSAVLRGFRNGVNHSQLFICPDGIDPVPSKIPPGVTLGGYSRNVSQWDIIFYSRAQPIYHFKNYTLFMNKVRHLLSMIYELFKLGL